MLTATEIMACSQNKTAPVDVLFAGQRLVPEHLIGRLTEHRYTWDFVSADNLENCIKNREIRACLVLDASAIEPKKMSGPDNLLEMLDRKNIAVILCNTPAELNLEKTPLASVAKTDDLNELWARIDSHIKAHKHFQQRIAEENQPACRLKISEDTQRQLEMAGHVQRNFLPSRLPNTENFRWATVFRPAEWVSGDIYDIARLDERHIGFYLADAVGHSMPAALLTMFLKQATVMRQTIGNDYYIFQPWEVMKTLNLRMSEQELAGCLFATSFYATLNTETLTMKYVRAGHPYPILIREDKIVQLQSRGGLLGVFPEAEFQQQSLTLHPHDKLFIYSDGGEPLVGESPDDHSFLFTEQFQEICRLPIEEMLSAYNQMAENYHFKAGETDDVTAIGLEIL
ncbi:MAG: serine/threonine-protein phosphatase [Phycisphaerae bacterium]|nr:serine/threonine-protein phosphatase [Phycisphaerae bacterium]